MRHGEQPPATGDAKSGRPAETAGSSSTTVLLAFRPSTLQRGMAPGEQPGDAVADPGFSRARSASKPIGRPSSASTFLPVSARRSVCGLVINRPGFSGGSGVPPRGS
jgi:hypothetical protein